MKWSVVCRPVSLKAGTLDGGLAVLLVDDEDEFEYEVTRVAFRRDASADPSASFIEALQRALDQAEEIVATLDELDVAYEQAKDERRAAERERIRDLLGAVQDGPR